MVFSRITHHAFFVSAKRMKNIHLALVALICVTIISSRAANAGDEVVVVYNSSLPESKEVAEHYAERRQVPANQVIGLPLSTNEEISRVEFRESLQQPLAKALETRKLWHVASRVLPATTNQPAYVEWKPVVSKIRYAVLCYGVPLRIAEDPYLKEENLEKTRPEMRRNVAAVDSELALLPALDQKLPLAGPLRNPLYTLTNSTAFNPTNNVLMVARLDGPTAAIARALVDKALEAEKDGLWGRTYFDLRNITDPGFKAGDDWIRNAAELCRRLGFETVVDDNAGTFPAGFPMSQIGYYIGWYSEHVCGPFAQPTVEFMPGAFAYHLHSFSAATLRSTTRHWVGPLLAKGATITMGCVDEPYLSGTPDMGVFTARLIFHGFSFGEAAYASQPVLSWQTTVVGDPLYRPFGRKAEQVHDELERSQNKLVEWSYLRLLNLNQVNGKPVADLVTLLEQLGTTSRSAVLTEKLGDLYLIQGKPSSAVHAYAQALERDPSRLQRLRLMLTLGDKLTSLERDKEAVADYQKLLQEFPDYEEKLAIYKKLLPLAQKLDQKADAEKYEQEIKKLSPTGKL
jgi:uncharacterized protein (TIGR03790 family)